MLNQLLARKLGMTQIFDARGAIVPVTALEVGPCTVVQVKTKERDGYSALQVAFGEERKKNRTPQADVGHFKKSGIAPRRLLREIRWNGEGEFKPGDEIKVDIFETVQKVDVIGISKGRGFMGAVGRWRFHGGPATHGQSDRERAPGSLAGGKEHGKSGPVIKGKRMAGHWGNERVTVHNLSVAKVDKEKNVLFVNGGVPGPTGRWVMVRQARWTPPRPSTVVSKKAKAAAKKK